MNRLIKTAKRLFQRSSLALQERGSVAIEFALALPIWIILLLGSSDAAFLMIISQRVDRIAYSVTDIVTQSEMVTINDLNNIMLAAGQLMEPFPFGVKGIVIVSSVYKPAGLATKISWQYAGGGSLARVSKMGIAGSTPVLPNGLTLNDNDNVIITEVYYAFTPLFINAGILKAADLYRVAIYKPRLSPLITPPT
ncbi:MAG: TadE/TadG family type IV pilus assembly protein [Bdellovibrionales bacterium]|jgi:hypothetical protein